MLLRVTGAKHWQICKMGTAFHRLVVYVQRLVFLKTINLALPMLDGLVQVEHPVTEGITDTNIPSIQLMIGMGIPLWNIPCLRATYNKDPNVGGALPSLPCCVQQALIWVCHRTLSHIARSSIASL